MKTISAIEKKIFTLPQILAQIASWRVTDKKIAFTNGCFDILHEGHIFSLCEAAKDADYLIIGLNSDKSTQRLKGPERPVNQEKSRALMLASLVMVDAVVLFEEDTPLEIITAIEPDILVKGGDYTIDQVVGAKQVLARGGQVIINPIIQGFSTTGIIEKIKASYS